MEPFVFERGKDFSTLLYTKEDALKIALICFACLVANGVLTGCTPISASNGVSPLVPTNTHLQPSAVAACPVSQSRWLKPPEDAAVQGPPAYSNYYVNEDYSIWVTTRWSSGDSDTLRAEPDGIKVGWYRPAGAKLEITGRRLDGEAPPLRAEVPCCYPTRFQASGLYFPTAGCWEVTARAADSELVFVVWVEP
jgi:hypothetical protein